MLIAVGTWTAVCAIIVVAHYGFGFMASSIIPAPTAKLLQVVTAAILLAGAAEMTVVSLLDMWDLFSAQLKARRELLREVEQGHHED